MKIYKFSAGDDDHMLFLPMDQTDFDRGVYAGDGRSRKHNWHPPRVKLKSDPFNHGKKVPDIGHVAAGSVVFSERAVEVLSNHLEPYGELLPLDVEGDTYFLYNVTNIIDAIDQEKSVKRGTGRIKIPAFVADKIPKDVEIFKVPETQRSQIYFHEINGENIKTLIEQYGLNGAHFRLEWEE
jgi:hypothetical protein